MSYSFPQNRPCYQRHLFIAKPKCPTLTLMTEVFIQPTLMKFGRLSVWSFYDLLGMTFKMAKFQCWYTITQFTLFYVFCLVKIKLSSFILVIFSGSLQKMMIDIIHDLCCVTFITGMRQTSGDHKHTKQNTFHRKWVWLDRHLSITAF